MSNGRQGRRGQRKPRGKRTNKKDKKKKSNTHGVDWSSTNIEEQMEEWLADILSPRTAARESAWYKISMGMQMKYMFEQMSSNIAFLTQGLTKAFKKGRKSEFLMAAKTFDILCITLGADCEELFESFMPIFKAFMKNPTSDPGMRAAAARSLTLSCFIGNTDDYLTIECFEFLSSFIFNTGNQSIDPEYLIGLVDSYNLIVTTLPLSLILRKSLPCLPGMMQLLQHSDVGVTVAVGETIGLLFYLLRENANKRSEEFNIKSYNSYVNVNHLLQLLKSLANSSHKQNGKKDGAYLRQNFKVVLKSIESEMYYPEAVVTVAGNTIDFCTWDQVLQYSFIRSCLGSGVLQHFEHNPLLSEIFELELDERAPMEKMSKVEKRMFKSKNSFASKARTRNRARDRQEHGRSQALLVTQEDY